MNPIQKIESDKRLSALLNGLKSQWGLNDNFLTIVLWHTDDYDLANNVIDFHMSNDNDDISLEESLKKVLSKEEFKLKCLDSEYLDHSKCLKLFKEYE